MNNKCMFCGNESLSHKHVRYIYQSTADMMIVDGVPCLECDYCQERYFDAKTLKKIEADFIAIAEQSKCPQRSMQVAIEEFAAL
ncbi:MAG: YgiT-type zinc finger protein [Mariprofundales bacterium]